MRMYKFPFEVAYSLFFLIFGSLIKRYMYIHTYDVSVYVIATKLYIIDWKDTFTILLLHSLSTCGTWCIQRIVLYDGIYLHKYVY